jgi:hypothetical protein
MNASLKSIWSEEPSNKQKEQRDFVLRHMLYQNRPCLLADHVQAHGGAAMRNKSEDVKNLLLYKGMKQVLELVTPANGRVTNEHMAIKRILLDSACIHLQKGQYTEAARLLDTSRRAISASTALAIDELDPEIPGQGPIFELRRGFLKVRGLERSNGLFCKTPAAIIEAITQYYVISAIACPGKHDVCTNPDGRSESEGKRLLFGNTHKHHLKCLKLVQEEQLDKWNETCLVDDGQCFDTSELYAVSTRSQWHPMQIVI